ncbi:squalene--hopene cyclase [Ectobacillus antri]|jgi:sporulenol synthase|uniref:Squalene--hopene cyclase n=1 Tax=Ectobacillus antri TaxID=2486280 RepID=A0ABT6H4J3_9BACI|nr:squalene--hopene cyclase [Ectobacillus antri]MDG4656814.1 squalene--hopene cyclase [Ectobacillus antri]MDG5754289.1 squalene--hopene cyclase [Ectobacillus antri]
MYSQDQIEELRRLQEADGTWRFCFEGAPMTDCLMIITMRMLDVQGEELIEKLTKRLAALQGKNGAWSLYEDERGNLSATVLAYTALLVSGRYKLSDDNIRQAEVYIQTQGGLARTHFMTKFVLAVIGQYPYPKLSVPTPLFLLPSFAPMSMYSLSNYARIHLVPMVICLNKRFIIPQDIDMSHLLLGEAFWFKQERNVSSNLIQQGKRLALYPKKLHDKGFQEAERFMLNRLEDNGTLYSYATSTFYMIYALLALGYKPDAPVIVKAMQGLVSYLFHTEKGLHLQNSPSEVWDTALLSYSLQEAGVPSHDPMIRAANAYLVHKQHNKMGDWSIRAPRAIPGGWGFSDSNTFVPDNDDTSVVLRALKGEEMYEKVWQRGLSWLLEMQNKDGGWGAFEKGADNEWLTMLPLDNAEDAIIDNSTPDVTGRVLEFFGNYAGLHQGHSIVKRGVTCLERLQRQDGSWYGRWGICYIYGTWAAVTGLRAVGVPASDSRLQRAAVWLESIQHSDGGFGESCRSSEKKRFVPLSFSTPSQTAWGVDALLAIKGCNAESVQRGIHFLRHREKWTERAKSYPTGLGLPGQFYIRYYSYNYIFPLLALAHYDKNNS